MPSEFPRSPRLLKGALVAYQLPELVPTLIVFQYNPEQLSRALTARTASGGGRGDAQRTDGPPEERITLTVEIDAVDQLEQPSQNGTTVALGLHPVIAALERLMYPPFPTVLANQVLSAVGSAVILCEPAPLALLIWGPSRILPVRVGSATISEQAFDANLNPILARVELALTVLTYRELEVSNPGYWVYMASFAQKDVLAAMNLVQNPAAIRGLLPI